MTLATQTLTTQTLTTQTLTTPQPPARIGCHGLLLSTPSCMHNKIAWRACWKAKHAPIKLMNSHRQGVSTVHIRLHINHHQSKTLSLPAGYFQKGLTLLKPSASKIYCPGMSFSQHPALGQECCHKLLSTFTSHSLERDTPWGSVTTDSSIQNVGTNPLSSSSLFNCSLVVRVMAY